MGGLGSVYSRGPRFYLQYRYLSDPGSLYRRWTIGSTRIYSRCCSVAEPPLFWAAPSLGSSQQNIGSSFGSTPKVAARLCNTGLCGQSYIYRRWPRVYSIYSRWPRFKFTVSGEGYMQCCRSTSLIMRIRDPKNVHMDPYPRG